MRAESISMPNTEPEEFEGAQGMRVPGRADDPDRVGADRQPWLGRDESEEEEEGYADPAGDGVAAPDLDADEDYDDDDDDEVYDEEEEFDDGSDEAFADENLEDEVFEEGVEQDFDDEDDDDAGFEEDVDEDTDEAFDDEDDEDYEDEDEGGGDDGGGRDDDGFGGPDEEAQPAGTDAAPQAGPGQFLEMELRVLQGPQAGSCLALAVGDYTLGASDHCSIILSGPNIEEEHALLAFDGSAASLRPLDGMLRDVKGRRISDETVLAPGAQISLGGVWISVSPSDTPWPAPETVGVIEEEDDVEEQLEPEAGDAPPSADDQQEPDAEVRSVGAVIRRHAVPIAAAAVLAVAAIGAVLAWVARGGDNAMRQVPQSAQHDVAQHVLRLPSTGRALQEFLQSFAPGGGLSAAQDGNGNWMVSGYLPTQQRLKAFQTALADISPSATAHIFVEDDLRAQTQQLLEQRLPQGSMLHVENMGGGRLRLKGAIADENSLQELTRALLEEVPGLRELNPEVLFATQLRQRFRDRLEEAGLARQLRITSDNPEMVLNGQLTDEQTVLWEQMLVRFNQEYGNALPIRASIGRISRRLPIGVRVIVSGPTPYIITDQGERVNLGSTINGLTLVSVRDGEVVFEGNQRYRFVR